MIINGLTKELRESLKNISDEELFRVINRMKYVKSLSIEEYIEVIRNKPNLQELIDYKKSIDRMTDLDEIALDSIIYKILN